MEGLTLNWTKSAKTIWKMTWKFAISLFIELLQISYNFRENLIKCCFFLFSSIVINIAAKNSSNYKKLLMSHYNLTSLSWSNFRNTNFTIFFYHETRILFFVRKNERCLVIWKTLYVLVRPNFALVCKESPYLLRRRRRECVLSM